MRPVATMRLAGPVAVVGHVSDRSPGERFPASIPRPGANHILKA